MRLAPYAVTMFNAPTISIEQIIPLSNVITILIANHSAQKSKIRLLCLILFMFSNFFIY
jgi:hypothetical protein